MDINRLRYFTVIARTGSMTEAAKILRISAPALSKAMSVLESEMGFPLFQNVGRGIALTDHGKKLLPKAERVLLDVDALKLETANDRESSRLRIGTFEVFSTYFLQSLMTKDFENFDLELHELVPGELEQALSQERIDIGITYIPVPLPGIDFLKVGSVKMAVYGCKDFLKNPDLKTLPFAVPILPIQGAPTKVNGIDGWPDDKLPRYQKYRVTLMESALQLCRQGLCVAYLPSFVAMLHNEQAIKTFQLEEIPIHNMPRVHQDVFLVKRTGTEEDRRIKQFAQIIRASCRLS
jgi:DNA-binding transcriptional LysR family regulator